MIVVVTEDALLMSEIGEKWNDIHEMFEFLEK